MAHRFELGEQLIVEPYGDLALRAHVEMLSDLRRLDRIEELEWMAIR